MTGHKIRLRGGWEWRDTASGTSRRVALPLSLAAEATSGVLLVRSFNKPPLDKDKEALWLRLEHVPGLRSVRLNGQEIVQATADSSEYSVPLEHLGPSRNVLVLELGSTVRPAQEADNNAWGEIALIVRSVLV